jgi:hypothetical protein
LIDDGTTTSSGAWRVNHLYLTLIDSNPDIEPEEFVIQYKTDATSMLRLDKPMKLNIRDQFTGNLYTNWPQRV